MASQRLDSAQGKNYTCISQREHFNYLRNNSCGVSGVFTWGDNQLNIQDQQIDMLPHNQYQIDDQNLHNTRNVNNKRRVSFDDGTRREQQPKNNKKNNPNPVLHQTNKRNPAESFQRKSKIPKDEEGERASAEEKRRKVQNYIAEQKPYSRGLSNSKFQQYFNKAAPECYGRANTNEPIGGVIYGNHLKTFNVNPHAYTNEPENYQTHTTALNYGKRTKVSEEDRWKRLQRELTKKLGLNDKNQTLKEGKEVVYQDVDDSNMYKEMKDNLEFKKANREEIHAREQEFKKEQEQQKIDDVNEFYAKKQDLIAELSMKNNSTLAGTEIDPEEYQAKLNQQVIYRHHDKNGNVRLGADRHALTCFVDLNFPQNDSVYTEELKNRMPIFPIKCNEEDKNIDHIRKGNYFKSKEEPYSSHYLLRNCDEPEVLKMLSEKAGVAKASGRKTGGGNDRQLVNNNKNPRSNVKSIGKTFASTSNTRGGQRQNLGEESFNMQQNSMKNKSEMINQAWNNSQLAGDIETGLNESCCKTEHLPHNEKNPRCYQNTTVSMGKIPFAG